MGDDQHVVEVRWVDRHVVDVQRKQSFFGLKIRKSVGQDEAVAAVPGDPESIRSASDSIPDVQVLRTLRIDPHPKREIEVVDAGEVRLNPADLAPGQPAVAASVETAEFGIGRPRTKIDDPGIAGVHRHAGRACVGVKRPALRADIDPYALLEGWRLGRCAALVGADDPAGIRSAAKPGIAAS
jgi:hypothetical protein